MVLSHVLVTFLFPAQAATLEEQQAGLLREQMELCNAVSKVQRQDSLNDVISNSGGAKEATRRGSKEN